MKKDNGIKVILASLLLLSPFAAQAQIEVCEDLAPGASTTVAEEYAPSPTGLPRNFIVKRDKANSNIYHVILELGFFITDDAIVELRGKTAMTYVSPSDATPGYANDAKYNTRTELRLYFQERVRQCFKKMEGRLKGADGTDIRLHANYDQSNGSSELYTSVKISAGKHRASSTEWGTSVDCPTIIHETLHLLGLVDGYEERDPTLKYSCRHLEPSVSLMNNQWMSLGTYYQYASCEGTGKPYNITKVDTVKMSCSSPFTGGGFVDRISQNEFQKWVATLKNTETQVSYSELPPPVATLFPAQIRMITKPHCVSQNAAYIACSQNAYRTEAQGCAATPSYCQTGEHLR